MAKHFSESDIEEFRDCFFLYARQKAITNVDELTIIMRSLGFSPTVEELARYYENYSKNGIIDFATFLDIMYEHSQNEKCQQEIVSAFQAHDKAGRGYVSARELVHILTNFGEKISKPEVDRLFKEAQVQDSVRCDDILRVLLTPLPDY